MLHIQETWVDQKRNCICGETPVYETSYEKVGELYRALVKQYGRCIGKMYCDNKVTGKTRAIGWIFLKRAKYEDCKDTYLQETWVSVHEKKEDTYVTYHYVDIAA